MGRLGKRVGLIHKLRQLTGTEKFFNNCGYRLGIHQVVWHERIDLLQAHALFDGAFHPDQTDTVLIFKQLTHRANPAVAQMVNIIHHTLRIP